MSSRFRVTGPSAFPSYRQSPGREPQVIDEGDLRSLRFSGHASESSMSRADPTALVLGYTRTMMGFLLFDEQPGQIGMIGLGGGSIAKYCRRHLPETRFIAVESDPRVAALRDSFGIPPDDAMFRVVEANGEDWVHDRAEQVDVLLLDGYTRAGLPGELCKQGFYDNCHSKLAPDGVLVANFRSSDPKFGTYASRLRETFDGQIASIDAAEPGSRILFAAKASRFDDFMRDAKRRVKALQAAHRLDFQATADQLVERIRSSREATQD